MTPYAGTVTGPLWWPFRLAPQALAQPGIRRVMAVWLVVSLLAVASAAMEARLDWSGIPVQVLGFTIPVTIYPPLILTWLLTIWIGPTWGMVPAYIATMVSGVVSGMSVPTAMIFATATPVELIILWGAMVIFGLHPDLRGSGALWRYIAASLVAATASSLAALIYIDSHQLGLIEGRYIWQGWIVGDTLQLSVLGTLVLRVGGGSVRAWVDRQFVTPPRTTVSYTRSLVIVILVVALLACVVFVGVGLLARSLQLPSDATTPSGEPLLPRLLAMALFLALLLVLTTTTTVLFAAAVAQMGEKARGAALRDLLTGCLNRGGFYELFPREADRSRRLRRGISIIYMDIDHFKAVNDRYGHETGDQVLHQLVRRVQGVIREHDTLFRWGGEEFVVLLPHTDAEGAVQLAERIRHAVAHGPLVREDVAQPIGVTVSLGTAASEGPGIDPDLLIGRADAACYQAKQAGRNRVGLLMVEAIDPD